MARTAWDEVRSRLRADAGRTLGFEEKLALAVLLLIPIILNAIALLPELTIPAPSLNDDQYHFLFIQQASQALANGQSIIDHWLPQVETGVPQFLYYQHLPALFVVALNRLSLGSLDLLTAFNLVRYLLMVLLPLTVFLSMRAMGFSTVTAAMAGVASSLLSSDFRYGFEYDSYTFRGLGLFSQLFAMHLCFVVLAVSYQAIQFGRRVWLAALLFGLLILTHVLYGYMIALALVPLGIWGLNRSNLIARVWRLGVIGVFGLVISSYMWVPFLTQSAFLNASPYLQAEKYDSFGAGQILGWITSGDFFDHGRLPILTLLLGLGILVAIIGRSRAALATLTLFVVWLVLYFGRPTLGGLVDLLPMHDGLLLHRFSGGVDLAAIVLMGVGAAALWEALRPGKAVWRLVAATAVFLVLLISPVTERVTFYQYNTAFLQRTQDAVEGDADEKAILAELRTLPPGRVYAGLPATYGKQMVFGDVFFYNLISFNAIEGFAPPNESYSLNSDYIWDFRDTEPADFDLYDARYMVAPTGYKVSSFLTPIFSTSRYVLYQAPTSGYAEYVGITGRVAAQTKSALFVFNRAWERNAAPGSQRTYYRIDYPASLPGSGTSATPQCPDGGHTDYERFQGGQINLVVRCSADATLMIKTSYHPNWEVKVDGQVVPTFMISPSYIGISLTAGTHTVDAVYRETPIKMPLLILGVLSIVVLLVGRKLIDGFGGGLTVGFGSARWKRGRSATVASASAVDGRESNERAIAGAPDESSGDTPDRGDRGAV